jgi:DNA-binding PadR family transcriptional regulator
MTFAEMRQRIGCGLVHAASARWGGATNSGKPRVDYQLTPLGRSLLDKVCGIWDWVETHMNEMELARTQFDRGEKRTERPRPLNVSAS